MENFIAELQRLTIVHEHSSDVAEDGGGHNSSYRISSSTGSKDPNKGSDDNKKENNDKKGDSSKKEDRKDKKGANEDGNGKKQPESPETEKGRDTGAVDGASSDSEEHGKKVGEKVDSPA